MRHSLLLAAVAASGLAAAAQAAEGMWLPNQTAGIARDLKAAGLQMDPAALGDLSKAPLNAIVSLGGCSAAFVSPQGLVATNHHCVYGSVQYNARAGQNYIEDGFLAATLGDELPGAPGTRIYVIEDLRDVTAAMHDGLATAGAERQRGLDAHRRTLIATCEQQPNRRCDVRPYFGGAAWYLQQQLEIKDVRLVYAPALGTGNFGGETDNWVWPRHTGDFGFYRAYVAPDGSSAAFDKANVPYRPKSWLKISQTPLKENDFVMVAGFPGGTSRLATAAEARFAFATAFPLQQKLLSDYSDRIAAATAGDPAAVIAYASIIKGADNFKKEDARPADRRGGDRPRRAQDRRRNGVPRLDRRRSGAAGALWRCGDCARCGGRGEPGGGGRRPEAQCPRPRAAADLGAHCLPLGQGAGEARRRA